MSTAIPLPEPLGAHDGRRDLERAIAELAERMPDVMQPLAALAFNYRWSWMVGGGALFHDIDPDAWRRSGCNPRYVIEAAPPRRFQELARDRGYVERLHAIADRGGGGSAPAERRGGRADAPAGRLLLLRVRRPLLAGALRRRPRRAGRRHAQGGVRPRRADDRRRRCSTARGTSTSGSTWKAGNASTGPTPTSSVCRPCG